MSSSYVQFPKIRVCLQMGLLLSCLRDSFLHTTAGPAVSKYFSPPQIQMIHYSSINDFFLDRNPYSFIPGSQDPLTVDRASGRRLAAACSGRHVLLPWTCIEKKLPPWTIGQCIKPTIPDMHKHFEHFHPVPLSKTCRP